jgi:D-alanyl-D-alanine carboxypeptidase/D-alanyl-D-alanine-endopeptidase (penicillin-binding protein 4)
VRRFTNRRDRSRHDPRTTTPVQRLQADLSAIFETPQFARSFWSVLVSSADAGDDLYSLNAAKLMMPGSTMKVVTLAAAAELLGWDHRFETRIVSSAPLDEGVLRGDLVIVGSGDPSISERGEMPGTLRAIARRVRDAALCGSKEG